MKESVKLNIIWKKTSGTSVTYPASNLLEDAFLATLLYLWRFSFTGLDKFKNEFAAHSVFVRNDKTTSIFCVSS
jgi:hypothetical protein